MLFRSVSPAETLYDLNQLCRDAGIYHISDEAFEHFTYGNGGCHFSPGGIAESADYTISLFSFSKSYAMASWRIGYLVIPEHLQTIVRQIQETVLVCPAVISQHAALAALSVPDFARKKAAALAPVHDMVKTELAAIGDFIHIPPTDGAFYFLIKVLTDIPAMPLAEHLIKKYKIAVLPGEAFGMTEGTHLRLAYTSLPVEQIQEGVRRLAAALREILTA